MTSLDHPQNFFSDDLDPYSEERHARAQEYLKSLDPELRERILTWVMLGCFNPWIREAYDPPFTALSFYICSDMRVLTAKILRGNWCLGQAFVLDDICFINQVDGGDEWLTIKGKTAFESITMRVYNESDEHAAARLAETVEAIRQATELQCKRLEYGAPYEEMTAEDGELVLEGGDAGCQQLMLSTRVDRGGVQEEECRFLLSSDHGTDVRVIKNDRARFALSVNDDGDVLLEHFRAFFKAEPDAVQVARIPAADVATKLGADFHDLSPVEQLHRLLPYLAWVTPAAEQGAPESS